MTLYFLDFSLKDTPRYLNLNDIIYLKKIFSLFSLFEDDIHNFYSLNEYNFFENDIKSKFLRLYSLQSKHFLAITYDNFINKKPIENFFEILEWDEDAIYCYMNDHLSDIYIDNDYSILTQFTHYQNNNDDKLYLYEPLDIYFKYSLIDHNTYYLKKTLSRIKFYKYTIIESFFHLKNQHIEEHIDNEFLYYFGIYTYEIYYLKEIFKYKCDDIHKLKNILEAYYLKKEKKSYFQNEYDDTISFTPIIDAIDFPTIFHLNNMYNSENNNFLNKYSPFKSSNYKFISSDVNKNILLFNPNNIKHEDPFKIIYFDSLSLPDLKNYEDEPF